MNRQRLHLLLGMTILLMLLASRVHADSLGQVTINGTTYDVVPQAEVISPAATFELDGAFYALTKTSPTTSPAVIATQPTTSPTSATQPATRERPTAITTGVPAGTILQQTTKLAIAPGGVYDGLSLAGTQTVRLAKGQSVTFQHCRIDCSGALYGVRCDGNLGTLLIDHCEIINASSAAIYGDNFTATSNYIHRIGGDGFKSGQNAVIDGNYVAELGWNSPSAHADGVQIRGGSNIRIVGNFFDMPKDVPNTKSNAALFLQLAAHDVTFDNNWCRGGNFAVHAYADGGGGPTIQITRNIFYANSTQYGFGSIGAGVVWVGNVTDVGKPATCKDK